MKIWKLKEKKNTRQRGFLFSPFIRGLWLLFGHQKQSRGGVAEKIASADHEDRKWC